MKPIVHKMPTKIKALYDSIEGETPKGHNIVKHNNYKKK